MCRSIRTLRGLEPPASADDVHAAALQFVRKVSGYRAPSTANREPFDAAVEAVSAAAERLLADLRPGYAASGRGPQRRSSEPT